MKIKTVKLKNFRSYKEEVSIDFDNLTTFVGKNDFGKSTILEALDIFINEGKGVIKIDSDDVNTECRTNGDIESTITVVFEDLPTTIQLDATNPTTLSEEHLLNSDGNLEIIKIYSNGGREKVFIKALHPTNVTCAELLYKKIKDLKTILNDEDIECTDKTKNAVIRQAIWGNYSQSLNKESILIDALKVDEKNLWIKIKEHLPLYTLFQSDRKNSDGDSEIQDPLKLAVKEILKDEAITRKLGEVAGLVKTKLEDVSLKTYEKLNEMNPAIANSLNPTIPDNADLKWADVFKSVSITGDEGIPINKRGSGVKRLILLNFFRAEAERRLLEGKNPSIVYAIEEPETSQHFEHQKLLINALKQLSDEANTQIIITTHSSTIVKMLDFDNLRLIKSGMTKEVLNIDPGQLPYPSLNEVNFVAFDDSQMEYHNELYGHIEANGHMTTFRSEHPTIPYNQLHRNGSTSLKNVTIHDYIRHQIHHPENENNVRFTNEQLYSSISEMRTFIQNLA